MLTKFLLARKCDFLASELRKTYDNEKRRIQMETCLTADTTSRVEYKWKRVLQPIL